MFVLGQGKGNSGKSNSSGRHKGHSTSQTRSFLVKTSGLCLLDRKSISHWIDQYCQGDIFIKLTISITRDTKRVDTTSTSRRRRLHHNTSRFESATSTMTRLAHFVSTFKALLIASLLLHQAHLTNAVSLSDFTPEASNLTASCEAVYTAQIPGCNAIDFQSPTSTQATCSSSCIQALVDTNSQVYTACSSDPQNNVQLIAAFLNGAGIQDLCPNVVVTTLVAGNYVQTTTPSTTPSGKITATVTADGNGGVVAASTTTIVTSTSSVSGVTMGSQVMEGTSVLVIPSSVSGSMSDGIIVDTRTPTVQLPTATSVTTVAASTTKSHIVTSTTNTASPLNTVTSTSTTTVSSTTSTSAHPSSSTSCASAEHGGSPFNYCTTNLASSGYITDSAALALVVGVGALLFLV